MTKAKNPPVPRFPHPPDYEANKEKLQNPPLAEMPAKKPRPPPVPEGERRSSQSPTVAQKMAQSFHIEKKPRVPKVAELLPEATLIMPVKPEDYEATLETNKSPS